MKRNDKPNLVIDQREKSSGYTTPAFFTETLTKLGVPNEVQTLQVGDYQTFDNEGGLVLVSRKAADLYSSLNDGHFQKELEACVNAVNAIGKGRVFMHFEGPWTSSYRYGGGGMSYFPRSGNDWFRKTQHVGNHEKTYAGMQVSAQSAGLFFTWAADAYGTCLTLQSIWERAQEGWPTKLTAGNPRPKLRWSRDSRVANLMGLWPGLNEKVAMALLTKFGSIGNIVGLAYGDPKALLATDGLGKKGLENLLEVLK